MLRVVASLSRDAFKKSNLFRKRMSLVVWLTPVGWFLMSMKEPDALKSDDLAAPSRLGRID